MSSFIFFSVLSKEVFLKRSKPLFKWALIGHSCIYPIIVGCDKWIKNRVNTLVVDKLLFWCIWHTYSVMVILKILIVLYC